MQPFSETDKPIDLSDCIYQSIHMPQIQPHFKAGLLLCHSGFNIERGSFDRSDHIENRIMFLILCEAGLKHYEERENKWYLCDIDNTPGRYVYLRWNFDNLFTTANGKSIQLKVVDARPDAGQKRVYKRSISDVGAAPAKRDGGAATEVIELDALLHEMKLASNAL